MGRKRVLVAGTFEYIHPGHLRLFRQASKLGDLYVVVARDSNARIAKGRKTIVPEKLRLRTIRSLSIVKGATLGGKDGLLGGIRKVKPDIIYLGPDQMGKKELLAILARNGLGKIEVRKMRKRLGGFGSSALLRRLLSDE